MGANSYNTTDEEEATNAEWQKHFNKMEGRTDWEALHKAASDKWGRRFGIHEPTSVTGWGARVEWMKQKGFKLAQIMLIPGQAYFPNEARSQELAGSIFRNITANSGIDFVVHSPYVIQIAGLNKTRKVSAKCLKVQCKLAQDLGMKSVVVHASSPKVGSVHENDTNAQVVNCWAEAVKQCNDAAPDVTVLIENPAWKKTWFSDPVVLAQMIRDLKGMGLKVGMCYDSAHHWAGVPEAAFDAADLTKIADVVKLLHYNDSPAKPESGLDRHSETPMGTGLLGAPRMKKVLESFPGVDCILERYSFFDLDLEYVAKSL